MAVTDDVSEASEFFVVPCEEEGKRRHFSIFYNSKTKLKQRDAKPCMRVKPIARYLCAYVNFRGICDNPLELKLNAKESKSMLVLHDRRSKHLHPVDLTDWINGKEIFYINCKHRAFKKDSYLSVTRHPSAESGPAVEGGETVEGEVAEDGRNGAKISTTGEKKSHDLYTTCCRPNISAHDDRNTLMLFRLIKAKQKDNWKDYDEQDVSNGETNGDQKGQVKGHKQGKGAGGGGGGKKSGKSESITEVTPEE